MKIITLDPSVSQEEEWLLHELSGELKVAFWDNGVRLSLRPCETGFALTKSGRDAVISYSSKAALARAFGLLAEHMETPSLELRQELRCDDLFAMIDNARDAVLTVASIKKTCRILAVMGYTSLLLYLEDLFPIEGEPYFGHFRGRFSAEELRECDDYAQGLGLELVPCVQTLAHLNGIFRWERFREIQDCTDILLADEEKTYDFLDAMLGTLSSIFRSRRINIGMDEAHLLGAGRYQQLHGCQDRTGIMLRHLNRVVELCKKHGLRPAMWSDMFFRIQSKDRLYYDDSVEITPEVAAMVPEDVELIYWDYYHGAASVYDSMLQKHACFRNPIQFAGGMWKWMGPAPLIRTSLDFSKAALDSVLRHGIRIVGVTAWNDNGATCPLFSCVAVWQFYAEAAWTGRLDEEGLSARLYACTGVSLEDLLLLDLPNTPPDNGNNPTANPALYLLFQDPLLGLYDRHILPGRYSPHYADAARELAKAAVRVSPEWRAMFRCSAALCRVLAVKAELGLQLKDAYDRQDRAALADIARRQLPQLLADLEELYEDVRAQWLTDYKPFGLEVQDIRYGGLMTRLKQTGRTLEQYLCGELPAVEELTQPRLYRDCRPEDSGEPLGLEQYLWSEIVSPNIL